MDDALSDLLDELHRHGVAHDAALADRLRRLRNVEPDTARLLALLVRATGARVILELGTSNGYSTLWLADAARSLSGHVLSVDVDAGRSAQAAANIDRADLGEHVELRVQDAAEALAETRSDSVELIFLDAERPSYPDYWPELVRVLRPGGLLVIDNAISHAAEMEPLRELIGADERVSEALVPTGAGALLVVREPAAVRFRR